MREGLLLVALTGYHQIIAEPDSSEVVEACIGSSTWWWTEGA